MSPPRTRTHSRGSEEETDHPDTSPTIRVEATNPQNTASIKDIYSLLTELQTSINILTRQSTEQNQELRALRQLLEKPETTKKEPLFEFDLGGGPSRKEDKGKAPEVRVPKVTTPVRGRSPSVRPKGPKYPLPEQYDGKDKGKKARQWLTRMLAYIRAERDKFGPDEGAAMTWFLSNTKDLAADWAEPLMMRLLDNNRTGPTANLRSLMDSFGKAFGDPDAGRAAHRKITELKQTGSAQDYATEFRTLMADLDWNDSAYMAQYRQGLNYKVQEVLSMRENQPADLESLMDVTITIDNIKRENEAMRAPKTVHKATNPPRASTSSSTTTTTVKRVPLTESANYVPQEERDRRRAAGVCIKCGKPGHGFKECRTGWRGPAGKEEIKVKKEEKKESGKAATVEEGDSSESESGKD
jgi:hypothetical protein